MITYIYIGLPFSEMFATMKFVSNKCEHAKYPAPNVQEEVTDLACALAKKERKYYSRKQHDHEDCKNKEYPNLVQRA